jgi:hypothetical protein
MSQFIFAEYHMIVTSLGRLDYFIVNICFNTTETEKRRVTLLLRRYEQICDFSGLSVLGRLAGKGI